MHLSHLALTGVAREMKTEYIMSKAFINGTNFMKTRP